MARRRSESAAITRGSRNVFEDLGYPDAAERQAKLRLAYAQPGETVRANIETRLPKVQGFWCCVYATRSPYEKCGISGERETL